LRDYAQARRTKKTKREQQYNHFYFIPVLSTQYKQKYIRARDKNAMAEQRLSDIRSEQERCRELLRETAKELTKQQQDREQAQQQWQTLEQEITKASKLVQFLKEGQTFWSQFDGHQSNLVLESGRYLIRALQEHKVAEDADFRHWIATFKMACMEYGEGEQYGDRKWDTGQMEVEYDCSRC
ncbi:uncharacterized protein BYT42DRAFT_476025, partial [Radiomyces spectabilis]|uniref:uncharacterized protein n=1 Tax=Radiomyces spectabilis TaxID=64574 RepID=UPI00221E4105